MRHFLFLASLASCFLFSQPLWAQGHKGYCDKAESTATSLKCLKDHLDSAQERLNKVYNNLQNKIKGEQLTALKNIQTEWLTYRDAECMWEADQVEDAPLKRANELSCMARVTEDRIDLLTTAYGESATDKAPREYGAFPRWMNVLAKDHKGIYWDYSNRKAVDLNCDGEDEHVMQGIKTSLQTSKSDATDENKPNIYTTDAVLAIVENPVTGRPKPTLFEYLVSTNNSDKTVCDQNLKLNVLEEKSESEDNNENKEGVCRTSLEITNGNCESKNISWTGEEFSLQEGVSSEK